MNIQATLSQLQSRRDRRRNIIRAYENEIAYAKCVRNERRNSGFFYGDVSDHIMDMRGVLKALVKDQKLDKKLYSLSLEVASQDRFFEMIRVGIGEFE